MNKRYDTTSALVRYIAGVFTLVAFVLLFGTILYTDGGQELKFADVFFNASNALNAAHVYGFIAQVIILVAGIFGILIPIVGVFTDNEKICSLIAGAVLAACGAIVLLTKVMYVGIEGCTVPGMYHLYGTTIAAGSLACLAGVFNVWAAFIKE